MATKWIIAVVLAMLLNVQLGKVFFSEDFESESWRSNWNKSKHNQEKQADFEWTFGEYNPKNFSKGIKTTISSKSYILSHKLSSPIFLNKTKVVIQYSIKFEQHSICGSETIKLLDPSFNPAKFGDDRSELITFGPLICGIDNSLSIFFESEGKGEPWQKRKEAPTSRTTHFYTLELTPEGNYTLYVDLKQFSKGRIANEWAMKAPVQNFVIGGVGISVWQPSAGTIFDNILITDSLNEALDTAEKFVLKYRNRELEAVHKREAEIKSEEEMIKKIEEEHEAEGKEINKSDL